MDGPVDNIDEARRSNWVRLRTLIVLRWIAIAGQIGAITVAQRMFDLTLDLGLDYLVVGALVISNLVATFVYPKNKRLSEAEMVALLLFDITQLAVLLYLTGGLNNPFALLILAPVTISATALQLRSTVLIGAVAILFVTLIARWNVPLVTRDGFAMQMPIDFVFGFWVAIVIGIIFLASYARKVTSEVNAMAEALMAAQLALAREQKLTDLGGVVAAAAHELGTPLATIKLVSGELLDELEDATLREDVTLIREQADRCRDILHSMGQAGKDDLHLRHAPLTSVVAEAAQPHQDRGREVMFDPAPLDGAAPHQPVVERRPEIIHGLRNLIQNAVDFAASRVRVDMRWDDTTIIVRIADDGPGFPQQVLPRIGDPFVRRRRDAEDRRYRPEYQGMGLGLFIAKTLLERTGAELSFANGRGSDGFGAIVEVAWPRGRIAAPAGAPRPALGENQPILR